MLLKRIARGIARATAKLTAKMTAGQKVFLVFLLGMFLLIIVSSIVSSLQDYRFSHLSAADHLRRAKAACSISSGDDATNCTDPDTAFREVWAISKSSPTYSEAAILLTSLQEQHRRIAGDAATKSAQSQSAAFDQMEKNHSGEAHDPFTCGNSTENKPIMSFDNSHWWIDDGRCAAQLQTKRDADAESSSYWSTTIRVDTDIDSSWLVNEERVCQTYPDDKGKISAVGCNATGSHRDHNIPVKFWGGVERNTISNWKCRRESDEFVCRAIN